MTIVKVFTLVYVVRADGNILMMRRTPDRAINAGRLSAPGGKVERGEGIIEAASRELREETGLEALDPAYRGCYAYTTDRPGNPAGIIHFVTVRRFGGELAPHHAEGTLDWYPPQAIFADPSFEADHRATLGQILGTSDTIAAIGHWKGAELALWHDSAPFYGLRAAS